MAVLFGIVVPTQRCCASTHLRPPKHTTRYPRERRITRPDVSRVTPRSAVAGMHRLLSVDCYFFPGFQSLCEAGGLAPEEERQRQDVLQPMGSEFITRLADYHCEFPSSPGGQTSAGTGTAAGATRQARCDGAGICALMKISSWCISSRSG